MKRIILFLAVMFAATLSYSQGEIDALQFSRNNLMGTARAISMGGAFGALGGDITGVAINPAGIGVYRSSEIVGTLNIEDVGTEAQLPKGISTTDNKVKFNLDNIGYVGYYPSGSDNVLSYNFGFAYNRLKNYDRKYNMQGMNMPVSLSDYAAHKSYDLNEDYLKHPDLHSGVSDPFSDMPWLSVLSYNAGIIKRKPNSMPHEYESVLNPGDLVNNHLSASEKGYVASYDFTFGMNIRDILSLGFTLSVTDIKHTADFYYSEDFSRGGNFFLTNWLQTNGDGLGLKIGAIVRPMDALRIGIAYHSPTWYSMSDRYSAMMEYSVRNYIQSPTDNIFDYKFQTPYKWVFSLAGVIGTSAIVSVDYELTNYSGMKFSTSNGGFSQDFKDHNSYMKEDLKSTSVLRAGLEFRITPQVSARLGYAWAETPFKKRVLDGEQEIITAGSIPHYVLDGDAHHFSIGAGYRFTRNFYMDLAVVMKQQKDKLYAFSRIFNAPEVNSIPADLTNSVFKGLLTFGYKF
jgi:long-subunit fatty acid transport protein